MKTRKNLVVIGSLLSSTLLSLNVQAQTLSYDVSDGNNPQGIFSGYGASYWETGDLVLPNGGVVLHRGQTLQLDLTLSGNVTLNDPSGSAHYAWAENFDPLSRDFDLGSVFIQLLENGADVGSEFGFDDPNLFGSPVGNYATGGYTALPIGAQFNGVEIFLSTSNRRELLTDFDFEIDGVPDDANTMLLLFSGVAALVGYGCRKGNTLRARL